MSKLTELPTTEFSLASLPNSVKNWKRQKKQKQKTHTKSKSLVKTPCQALRNESKNRSSIRFVYLNV